MLKFCTLSNAFISVVYHLFFDTKSMEIILYYYYYYYFITYMEIILYLK